MSALKAIHVARRQLGLDDDDYRAVLERVTGKRSLAEMTEAERRQVVDELRRLGFSGAPAGRQRLSGPYAKKLQALWLSAWNLGIVRNRDDKALIAFVERQTGISHVRWVREPGDAAKAIEALKSWLGREADVDWTVRRMVPAWTQANGYRIAVAQLAILKAADPAYSEFLTISHWLVRFGLPPADRIDSGGWIEAINRLGQRIRGEV
jgi:hypothetical protein